VAAIRAALGAVHPGLGEGLHRAALLHRRPGRLPQARGRRRGG